MLSTVVASIRIASLRPADMSGCDVDLETFHGWFTTTDLSHTDEDSESSSLQSPTHGISVYRTYTCSVVLLSVL